jgi:hypothetical protein
MRTPFTDPFDDPDEAAEELFGFHVEDGTPVNDGPTVCEWGCGDAEGLCVLDRHSCFQLGCELVSEV